MSTPLKSDPSEPSDDNTDAHHWSAAVVAELPQEDGTQGDAVIGHEPRKVENSAELPPARHGLLPGLVVVALGTVAATLVGSLLPSISALTVGVVLGALLGNLGVVTPRTKPGFVFAAKKILRFGIVLLGLRLSVGQVLDLGAPTLMVVAVTVAVTFFGTQWLGQKMGLSRDLSLLVATGYSICGASAIAAVEGATDAEEEEVAMAIGLVTIFGSLAILVLPPIAGVLNLSEQAFGAWVGASVHDVAQVVATGAAGGSGVLAVAVVVKLSRVVLLAPIVAGVNLSKRRRDVALGLVSSDAEGGGKSDAKAPPLLPGFVIGFLAMVMLRTTELVPDSIVADVKYVEGLVLTAALVGLGSGVQIQRLRSLGKAPLVLGLVAWVVVAAVSLACIQLFG